MKKQIRRSFTGQITDMKKIATRTGRSMITFTANGRKCKAFGDVANACLALDGKEVQVEAREGSFRGEEEYTIISVSGKLEGQEISKTDTRTKPVPQSVAPTGPTPPGMMRWSVRPGEHAQFRAEIVKYGNARMLEIFDKLPHPQCSEERWGELWTEFCKVEKVYADELREHARSQGFTDGEINKCTDYWSSIPGWNAGEERLAFAKEVCVKGLSRDREWAEYLAATSKKSMIASGTRGCQPAVGAGAVGCCISGDTTSTGR